MPAYVANIAPVFAGSLKLPLGSPISQKLFGAHKTWRSFYVGYIGSFLILLGQRCLHSQGIDESFSLLDYRGINLFFYAFLFGMGAIVGDLAKSFFKRRQGIKEGGPWVPFDQLDLVVGGLVFVLPFYSLPWENALTLLLITPPLHFLSNVLGYWLKLKKVWW